MAGSISAIVNARVKDLPWSLIRAAAYAHAVPPTLVAALVLKTSGGAFWKSELRPTFPLGRIVTPELFAKKHGTSVRTEVLAQMHTYGYLQLVGAAARWLGFEGHLPQVALPETGLLWGCKYLAWVLAKHGLESGIAAFAVAGEPALRSVTDLERLVNQEFVADVLREREMLEQEGSLL
jgi:hypothetical protein